MKHIVYETTNKINGKKYIGKHSTDDLDDGYLGSGSSLKSAINKYGKENFERVTLKEFNTEQEAYEYEEELVTMDIVTNDVYYNLMGGGDGGTKIISIEVRKIMSLAKKGKYDGENNPNYGKRGKDSHWFGKHHTEETKKKMSEAQRNRTFTEHHKNVSIRNLEKIPKNVKCEYCGKICSKGNYVRWHGKNCKTKGDGI